MYNKHILITCPCNIITYKIAKMPIIRAFLLFYVSSYSVLCLHSKDIHISQIYQKPPLLPPRLLSISYTSLSYHGPQTLPYSLAESMPFFYYPPRSSHSCLLRQLLPSRQIPPSFRRLLLHQRPLFRGTVVSYLPLHQLPLFLPPHSTYPVIEP